jgi:hypothetical protein
VKRRQLLVAGVSVAASAAALTVAARMGMLQGWSSGFRRSDLGPDIDVLLAAAVGAGGSGEQLAARGRDAEVLAARLRSRLSLSPERVPSLAEATRMLGSAIVEDFADARVLEHAGWLLSETEADLARLRWLVAGKRVIEAPAGPVEESIAEVKDWGPRRTIEGVPFLVQPDGHYGLWFSVEAVPLWIEVRVAGAAMPTFVNSGSVTSGIHGSLRSIIDKPGTYPIEFFDPPTGRVQHVGDLEVVAKPAAYVHADGSTSAIFCELEAWGPDETRAGMVVNPQPDGSMGVWVRTSCVPPDSTMMFGDVRLATSIQTDAVTARVPLALLEVAGEFPIEILHFGSGERLPVGTLRVLAGE